MRIEFNKSKDEVYVLPCTNCGEKTRHKVLSSVECSSEEKIYYEGVEYNGLWYLEEFQIIICLGCEEVSFRSNMLNSEDDEYYFNNKTGQEECRPVNHQKLYPKRLSGRKELKDCKYLPDKIYKIYDETFNALCGDMPILAAIGVRALIEAICNHKKAKGRYLNQKIIDLVEKKFLNRERAKFLHKIKILGNDAAHKIRLYDNDTLGVALDIAEHLLVEVYILPRKVKSLPKVKNQHNKKKK